MDVLTLNVGAASVERALLIADWVEGQCADVVVLTETSSGQGTHLLYNRLLGDGYRVDVHWRAGDRGVLLATMNSEAIPTPSILPSRLRAARITADNLTIVGLYGPSRSVKNRDRKQMFFASVLDWLGRLNTDRLVLVGDYNAIPRDHEPRHVGFKDFEYAFHDGLAQLGLRAAHGEPQPHSWFGRSGAGYLYDYVHLGAALAVSRCEYIDAGGLSDHSAVLATVEQAPSSDQGAG
jgi:exonuclease III